MNLIPLGSRVIIEKPEPPAEHKSSAGLLLPGDSPIENEGTVVAVAAGVYNVSPGDRVIFPEFGGVEITEQEIDYVIIAEEDLVAKRGDSHGEVDSTGQEEHTEVSNGTAGEGNG